MGTDDTLQKIVKRMTSESLLHCPTYDGKVQDFSIVKGQYNYQVKK